MSDLNSFRREEMNAFGGQRSFQAAAALPARLGAEAARNVEFEDSFAITRRGFANAFAANPAPNRIRGLHNWLMPTWNRLMMFIPHATTPSVRWRDLGSSLEENVVTGLGATVTAADFQEYGSRMFMAFLGDDGRGKARPKVWNGLFSGSGPIVDDVFAPPPAEGSAFSASYSEPGGGVIDAGEHRVGLLFETRNGHTTKALELNTAFTASGGANLQVTLSPVGTWAATWFRVRLLLTTVQNPHRYWIVPGVEASGFGGTAGNVLLTADIADTTLSALNELDSLATDYFSLYAWNDNGVQVNAKALLSYAGRMVYIFDAFDATSLGDVTRAMVSDVGDPQRVSLDQHQLRLPANLPITTGFVFHNQLCLVGPSWIYAVVDNGDKPATWAEPQLIDGRVGTPVPKGVAADPTKGLIFLAHPKGLFVYNGGVIPDKPLSYHVTDQWRRINWNAPKDALKVIVDGASARVIVAAPLDSETEPTRCFTWNYRNGHGYDRVDFAMMDWDYDALSAVGAAAVVNNGGIPELWLANGASAAEVQRQKSQEAGDANLYRDGSSGGYVSSYKTGSLPRVFPAPVNHHAIHVDAHGAGSLAITAHDKDSTRSRALSPVTLAAAPGKMALRRISLKSEDLRLTFSNGGVADAWWKLSYLRIYWKEWVAQR